MEFLGLDIIDILVFIAGMVLGGGPMAMKLKAVSKLVKGAAKYLDDLSTPNDELRRDAIQRGIGEVAEIIDRFTGEGKAAKKAEK